jgi:hypothetical protein
MMLVRQKAAGQSQFHLSEPPFTENQGSEVGQTEHLYSKKYTWKVDYVTKVHKR